MGSQPKQIKEDRLIGGIVKCLTNWNKSYGKWAIIFFLGLSIYRTTTDGLWFIAFVVISFAYNLESHVKSGSPLIREKKVNQSIREYGVGRALSTLIFSPVAWDLSPALRSVSFIPPNMMYLLFGRAILTLLLLHLYVILIILFDLIDRDLCRSMIIQFNQPFEPIISVWHGLGKTVSNLRVHYHKNLIPIVEHLYLVTLLFFAVHLLGMISYLFKSDFYQGWIAYYAHVKKKFDSKKGLDCSSFGRVIVGFVTIFLFAWAFFYLFEIMLYFEGDPLRRHGKYIWMYNYMYKDYLGYFTPAYTLGLFFVGITFGVVYLLEFPYRCWMYFLMKINRCTINKN